MYYMTFKSYMVIHKREKDKQELQVLFEEFGMELKILRRKLKMLWKTWISMICGCFEGGAPHCMK